MADNFVTRILITAKDEASNVFGSLQAKAAGVATAIAGYFTANFLGGAITSAADFEAAMSRVAAATGATGDELLQLKQAAEDAAAGSAFTQVEAAQGLENLSKAGLNAREAIAALPGVMALAAAGDIELSQSAEIVTRTVAGMGIAVEETGRIADVLAKGANASNTSVKGLAEALSYTAPTARSAGLTLEQTVAVLGKFADGGIDASRAGTALNAILSQFIDPASKFRGELAAIGITTGDFDKALRQLAASGETGSKAILAVGTEAGPALRSLLNQGVPALDKLKAQLDEAAGSAANTAGIMGTNLNGAFGMLSGAWDALKIKLGEPVLPVLTNGVRDLAEALRGAVADGTATKFGEAIKSAFSSGIEWVRKFAAEVDPAALTAKLQDMAGKVGTFFDDLATKAATAGSVIQTAWGVMSSGASIVMAGVYKISEAFAGVSSNILGAVATIADGLSKVTFGGMSASFKAAADEIRLAAGGMGAVSKAYADEAGKAFDAAAEGAETARAGWAGLTKAASDAAPAVGYAGQAAEATAKQLQAAGQGAAEAGQKLETLGAQAKQSAAAQKASSDDLQKSIEDIKKRYDELFEAGRRSEADVVWKLLQQVMRETGQAAEGAGKQLQAVGQAAAEAGAQAKQAGTVQKASVDDLQKSIEGLQDRYDELFAAGRQGEAEVVWKLLQQVMRQTAGVATETGKAQTSAAADSTKAVADLRAEYDKLIAGGKVNEAVLKLEEIRKALGGLKTDAKATAADLEAAYRGLGITSTADLKAKEQEFRRYYDAIKTDGTATADMLAQAFKAYAEKAIAANGGVASEALKSEASLRGVRIEADETGKAIVKIGGAAGQAGNQVRSAMDGASSDIRRVRTEADQLQSRLQNLKGAGLGDNFGNQSGGNGTYDDLRKAGVTGQDMQRMGYSQREIEDYLTQNDKAAPGTVNRQVTSSGVNTYQMAVSAGLNDAEAKRFGELYGYYAAQANRQAQAQAGGTLGLAFNGQDYAAITRDFANQAMAEARRQIAEEAAAGKGGQGAQANNPGVWGAPVRTVNYNLTINGNTTQLRMADQQSADDLTRILQTQLGAQP